MKLATVAALGLMALFTWLSSDKPKPTPTPPAPAFVTQEHKYEPPDCEEVMKQHRGYMLVRRASDKKLVAIHVCLIAEGVDIVEEK